jgi:hypothetical protein
MNFLLGVSPIKITFFFGDIPCFSMSPRATNQEPEMLLPVVESGNDGLHIHVLWTMLDTVAHHFFGVNLSIIGGHLIF